MAKPSPLKVVQVCSVAPLQGTTTPSPITPTSLPLTFFDLLWLRFPPVERLFFYEFQHSPSSFYDSVLPSLKHSLSLTLQHFLPFSGNIIWPLDHDSLVPTITYVPGSDAVQFTVAESNSNFTHLISDLCEASKRHHLIPHLATSHEKASVMAIQVTLFPNTGLCIGIATHHAALDGKSSTSFMKSWAYTCSHIKKDSPMHETLGRVDVRDLTRASGEAVFRFKSVTPNTCSNNSNNKHGDDDQSQSLTCLLSLPQHLTPFFDRSVIRDPNGISQVFADALLKHGGPNNRSLKVWEHIIKVKNDAIKGLFELTPLHIQKLKQYANSKLNKGKVQLSTFSVTCAYVLACLVKAEQPKAGRVVFIFSVDCRYRLDPPIVPNYVGNCVAGQVVVAETKDLIGEDGFINALEGINEALDRVKDDGVLNGAENWISEMLNVSVTENKIYSIAGSPRFEVYGVDFGWGRPKKVDLTSIDKTGAFSLSESRNDNGGIEIGLVLNKQEMEAFSALFVQGLESL